MDRLIELAERCEKASGADAEFDMLIWCTLNEIEARYPTEFPNGSGRIEGFKGDQWDGLLGWVDPGKVQRNFTPCGGEDAYPKYTASLDAAMSLVPEGCAVDFRRFANGKARAVVWRTVTHPEPPFEHPCERAASAALAITAASLRARATKEQTND